MTCPLCESPLTIALNRGNVDPHDDGNEISCSNPDCEYADFVSMGELRDIETDRRVHNEPSAVA